jgi:tetratricopeptide (TPR) repeat protein
MPDRRNSQFSRAIALANQIKPGEPLYDEAQQAIARWSQVIFDTAEGRAAKGKFEEAIGAASLIPKDQPMHEEAQKLIARWRGSAKQQQTNRNILQGAKKLIQPEQASSYNKAIDLVRQIPSGQPGSAEAKNLTSQWSQSILNLAQARASEGSFDQAIQTASLIPSNTPAYPKAKVAIEQWKRQLSEPKK